MTPEPPPGQTYQPPPPPPESQPPDMRYQGLYDPLVPPQLPVRTRIIRIVVGLFLAFGVLIGMFLNLPDFVVSGGGLPSSSR